MGRVGSSSRRKHSKKKSLKVSPEARRKKLSRRKKSKKLRRHDDSFSSFSEDESASSSSLSSSSSDGDYKSKRSRSRARSEEKGGKKRTRSRSLSEDSSHANKRKGSKKSDSRKKNKKIKKKKKKPKRDVYISSASSDSASCSTCKDGDSSSDEERSRGRSREKKRNHRYSSKGRDGNRKNRSRTSSSSPSKLNDSYDEEHIEEVAVENNSRRLKSVITIAKPPENELKEEIVYDYDDYPSCKSNDSNELVDRSNISPEKKMPTSMIGEVNSASSPNEKESNASGNVGSDVDNLESILRQKALENLSKFRGGVKTKPVAPVVVDKHKSDQNVAKQPASASVSMTPVSQPVPNRSRFTWRRDPSVTTPKDEKAVTYSGPESSGSQPAAAPKLQSAENKIVNETLKSVANNNDTSGGTGTNDNQKSTTALETPSASTKEGSSKGQQTENNDNSQFEKKTMSVMRGGEMVQVSYKVYIPNRAPALARRQLKR